MMRRVAVVFAVEEPPFVRTRQQAVEFPPHHIQDRRSRTVSNFQLDEWLVGYPYNETENVTSLIFCNK